VPCALMPQAFCRLKKYIIFDYTLKPILCLKTPL